MEPFMDWSSQQQQVQEQARKEEAKAHAAEIDRRSQFIDSVPEWQPTWRRSWYAAWLQPHKPLEYVRAFALNFLVGMILGIAIILVALHT